MASVNKVILIGHLGKDPETRYMPNGDATSSASIATTDTWKDKATGEKQERTEWHRVVFFRRLAEIVKEYLLTGSKVYIEGHLRTRKYTDKSGADRYITEIIADDMKMLGSRPNKQSSTPARNQGPSNNPSNQNRNAGFDDMEDDVPF